MSEATKATHTPGPWRTAGEMRYISSNSGYVPIRTPFRDKAFSDGPERSNYSEDELSANARLIAAAPELLEALEQVSELWESDGENPSAFRAQVLTEMPRIRAAIAKARG